MKAQHCFPVLTFDFIRERYVVATTSEGFSTSGNAVLTSQERAARTEVAYNPLDGMNRLGMGTIIIIHGLFSASQSTAYTLTLSLHHDGLT